MVKRYQLILSGLFHLFSVVNDVQRAELLNPVVITLGPSVRRRLASSVSRGHRTHRMSQTPLSRIFLTIVFRQQGTTVEMPIRTGKTVSGVTQRIRTCTGNRARFLCAPTQPLLR